MKKIIPFLLLIAGLPIQSCRQSDELQEDEQQLLKRMQGADSLFTKELQNNDSISIIGKPVGDSISDRKKKHPPVRDGQDW